MNGWCTVGLKRLARQGLLYRDDNMSPPAEQCRNPWNPGCGNANIEVYIVQKDQQLPICSTCWSVIAEEDFEWRE